MGIETDLEATPSMETKMSNRIPLLGVLIRTTLGLLLPISSLAEVVKTTDPEVAAAFMAGASIERFDDLDASFLDDYGPGQTIDPDGRFNTRDGTTQPTFNSGGGSLSDPVGNPGTPIGIFRPRGPIAADLVSPSHVAGPLVVTDDTQPFNGGFIEVFFVEDVARVGFWVTHGSLALTLLDGEGLSFDSGDALLTATEGEFVGIDRGEAEIGLAAMIPFGGADAFTIDDFVWSRKSLTEPSSQRLAYVGQVVEGQQGVVDLEGASGLATSRDGRNVYALSQHDHAIVVFERDPHTGRLVFLESHRDGVSGADGLQHPLHVVVSPDDRNLYVTASENTLAVFSRDPVDGRLGFVESFREGVAGVAGLSQPFGLAISPDGAQVYVAGHVSQAIATFDRDPADGALSFRSTITEGISDIGGLTNEICMSPDGRHLYAASFFDMLGVYARDSQTGDLGLVEVEGLAVSSHDCVVSPDGRFVYTAGANGSVEVLSRDLGTGAVASSSTSESAGFSANRVFLSADGAALYLHDAVDEFAVFERDRESGSLRLVQGIADGAGGVDGIGGVFTTGPVLVSSADGRHVYGVGSRDEAVAIFSTPRFQPAGCVAEGTAFVEDALGEPVAVEISADGRYAYVAGRTSDTVAIFEIEGADPGLVYLERKKLGEIDAANGLLIEGLDGASDLALSPDGAQLYTTGETDGAIVWFDREPDGALVYRAAYVHPDLAGASAVRVSNDGLHVYATAEDASTWVTFERGPDGSLVVAPEPGGGIAIPRGLVITPDDGFVMITNNNGDNGLTAYRRELSGELVMEDFSDACGSSRANQIEMSRDGRNVYLTCASPGDLSRLEVLAWDGPTRSLTKASFLIDTPGGAVEGLGGALGLSVSHDDAFVAVAGPDSDGFALFARDPLTGELHLAQKELEGLAAQPLGLLHATDVEFSPDGRYLLAVGGGEVDGTIAIFVPEPERLPLLAAGVLALVAFAARRGNRGLV